MLECRGTYRGCYEMDKRTGKPAEFTYIVCKIKKGANIYRYNNDTLNVYIPSIRIANSLLKEHSDIFKTFIFGDREAILQFPESRLSDAAKLLKPMVLGKNVSPRSKRNLRLA